jgi:hypothetical protein
MQLRAYELWSSLLRRGHLPLIADLEPGGYPSLSPFSVLLDFSARRSDPAIAYLGERLAAECGIALGDAACVSHLPERCLLARVAEHYVKPMISSEPIGFEAEFVNQRGKTILYRGILLPFSRQGRAIEYVFAVIGWKELADPALVESLEHELGRALMTALEPAGAVAAHGAPASPACVF